MHDLEARGVASVTYQRLDVKQAYDHRDAAEVKIQGHDVVVFGIQAFTASTAEHFKPSFYDRLRQSARVHNTPLINLTDNVTTSGCLHSGVTTKKLSEFCAEAHHFPLFLKANANGSTQSGYKVIANREELDSFQNTLAPKMQTNFVVQPFLTSHDFVPGKLFKVERWLYVFGDLTVGIRVNTSPFIKQYNSFGWLTRDERSLANDFKILKRLYGTALTPARHTFLSYAYTECDSFWNRRKDFARDFATKNNFEWGTLDIIQSHEGKFDVIDVNHCTTEYIADDLRTILSEHMWRTIEQRCVFNTQTVTHNSQTVK